MRKHVIPFILLLTLIGCKKSSRVEYYVYMKNGAHADVKYIADFGLAQNTLASDGWVYQFNPDPGDPVGIFVTKDSTESYLRLKVLKDGDLWYEKTDSTGLSVLSFSDRVPD
jgi:hypothetical protein